VIRSFKDKKTAAVGAGENPKGFPSGIVKMARRKLIMLDNATALSDLRVPPANRLEELRKDRQGQHSIRVNDQFRVCFRWVDGNAEDVEITDYHD
jgi:proteic killer suppression protein